MCLLLVYLRLHKFTAGDELHCITILETVKIRKFLYILGQWMNRLILYSQMLKLTFAVRPSCEVPKLQIFGTFVLSVTS